MSIGYGIRLPVSNGLVVKRSHKTWTVKFLLLALLLCEQALSSRSSATESDQNVKQKLSFANGMNDKLYEQLSQKLMPVNDERVLTVNSVNRCGQAQRVCACVHMHVCVLRKSVRVGQHVGISLPLAPRGEGKSRQGAAVFLVFTGFGSGSAAFLPFFTMQ